MPLFSRNIISGDVVKAKSDKLMKSSLRDAKKKIRKGELTDSHDLALYLRTIDARYTHLQTEIANSRRVHNYSKLRATRIAETRQLLDFFSHDHAELDRLSQIVTEKAKQAGRIDDLKHEKLSFIDLTKLKNSFNALTREEKDNGANEQ